MDASGNIPEKKADGQKQVYTVRGPQDKEKCKGCPYPGVGFICWSTDGSCMRTDMDRISKSRR